MVFSGRSMGGGNGGALRTIGRIGTRVRVSGNGIQDPLSSSSSTSTSASPSNSSRRTRSPTSLSLSSPVDSHATNPVSGFDWVIVEDEFKDEGFNGFSDSHVLGSVPSEQEVDEAIFSLQKVFCSTSHFQSNNDNCGLNNDVADIVTIPGLHVTTYGSEVDWREPSMSPYDTRMWQSSRYDEIYHAFRLLETEPTVQKMVKSLSSDKAVWDAVLNNEAVRELQESFTSDDDKSSEKVSQNSYGSSTEGEAHSTTNVVMWIIDHSRAKFMGLIENIKKIVKDLFPFAFHKSDKEADFSDPFTERLRTSFMLTIMVLLVVVVGRVKRA